MIVLKIVIESFQTFNDKVVPILLEYYGTITNIIEEISRCHVQSLEWDTQHSEYFQHEWNTCFENYC